MTDVHVSTLQVSVSMWMFVAIMSALANRIMCASYTPTENISSSTVPSAIGRWWVHFPCFPAVKYSILRHF
ncbi:hypothetical protein B0H13DRAFT_1966935 [Mycena leptocephala]|nr:hypothetical protein B0H13DRAFT_1966935 [Mycena leptocephala]